MRTAPIEWIQRFKAGNVDHLAMGRALFRHADVHIPQPSPHETFHWVVEPSDGLVTGKVYTDGSSKDGKNPGVARDGWAFVAVNEAGEITAAARGLPPPWVVDIPATEAWAVLQAAMRSAGDCRYLIDCLPCVDAIRTGAKWATAAQRRHARVHALLHAAIDEMPREFFTWMPAHSRPEHVGVLLKGYRTPFTAVDRQSNEAADGHAKAAVEEHRVPLEVRRRLIRHDLEVQRVAKWIGLVAHRANHLPH